MNKVNEQLKDRNTRLAVGFMLSADRSKMTCKPLMAVEKVDKAKRGKATSVVPTFCPFCGNAYQAEEAEEAA